MKYLIIGLLILTPQLSMAAGIVINDEVVEVGGIRVGEDGSVSLPGISIGGDGSVDIGTEGVDIEVNTEHNRPQHRPRPENDRELIVDGVFFDDNNKAHNVKTGEFNRLNLSNIDLSYYDLSGSDFSRTTFNNVSFAGADLTGVNFQRAKFNNVDFTGAIIAGSCFTRNTFIETFFIDADITDAIFARYEFINTSFNGTNKGVAQWLDDDDCSSLEDYDQRVSNIITTKPVLKPVHYSTGHR